MIDSKWIWCVVVVFPPGLASPAAPLHVPVADSERVQEHLTELARFGAKPEDGVGRVAYSDADIAGRAYVGSLVEAAGLDVRAEPV
jgi:beta-ureidopropionase / N-carbamoyl-L-amino-acid hydrolase